MRGAWVNEVRPSELTNVSQSLEYLGIDELERQVVDADVVPDGVAQNLEAHRPTSLWFARRQPFGPAFLIAVSTLPNFAKFSRNIVASFFACPS